MVHIYYDATNDSVYRVGEFWYCNVDGREFGGWVNKPQAVAGMTIEQERSEKRRLKNAELNQ